MNTNTNDTAGIVRKLIETCRDGEKGFNQASENVHRPDLRTFFKEKSQERGRFAQELEAELAILGKPEKDESGSVSGAIHRAWVDLKSALGSGDEGILAAAEQGEDNAKESYEDALREPLPPATLEVVRRQVQSIRTTHDRVKSLRDNLAA